MATATQQLALAGAPVAVALVALESEPMEFVIVEDNGGAQAARLECRVDAECAVEIGARSDEAAAGGDGDAERWLTRGRMIPS